VFVAVAVLDLVGVTVTVLVGIAVKVGDGVVTIARTRIH
jgi:hypothetical protein